jgi:replicative superfamily II helicase
MSGRAGRKGLEVVGESFLVHDVREPPPRSYLELLLRSGVMQSVHSRLLNDQQNNGECCTRRGSPACAACLKVFI